MKASRKLNRRSFFASVAGGMLVGGGAVAFVAGRARAQSNQTYTGVTDADTGAGHADRPGYGTGVRNRYTDRDTGPNADPQFGGRGPNAAPNSGAPSGTGSYAPDQRATGCSDADAGSVADPGGRGRTCNSNGYVAPRSTVPTHSRECSDRDTGYSADPLRRGQHCQ